MTDEEFSKGQIALIEQIAYRVGEIIADRISKDVEKAIKLHAAECPTQRCVEAALNQGKGAWKTIAVVSSIVSAVIGWALNYIRIRS